MRMLLRSAFCVRRSAFGVCLFLAIASTLSAQVYQGKQLVKAELLADTTAIVPGKPFAVGVLLRMAPGWHTYWKYSGDAGLPTELKWKLLPDWKIGEIKWPIPLKLNDPGDILTYGYSDEVLLMQEITPPEKIDASSITLSADANWLVCERICIPGSATLQLTMPISTSSAPANPEVFSRYRALLPQPWPNRNVFIKGWMHEPNGVSITLQLDFLSRYSSLDFYPLPDEKSIVGHASVTKNGDTIAIQVPFESAPTNHIRGLLVAGGNDPNRAGWYFEVGPPEDARPASSPPTSIGRVASTPSRGLVTYLLFGVLGGFILNLMPCVLPVISLKIFGFVKQAGQDRRLILRNGLAFVAGIFVWFIGLALLLIALKAAGHQVTWAAQFTNPYFVLILSVIVLVFALDLFGVFEIALPQALMHRMLHSATREGELGSFFQGVFATALATPCTAPFLGTALGFAFTQSALIIFSMFIAIAVGMSAPYLLLSAQPAWLRFLPKPGPWMEHVKQFMGFLLLATLLFLLYVLGAQRGYEALIWASAFLLIISIACWMKGSFVLPTSSATKRSVVLVLMLLLVIGGGFYFIGNKFRSATVEPIATESIQSRLDAELAQGHPVFIDFTAAWCITCKFNDKAVLDSAEVREAFQSHGVTKLVADWTNGDPEITKMLQQFGRPGVPLYVLYPGKSAEPVVFPELLTKSIILDKLQTISRNIASQ